MSAAGRRLTSAAGRWRALLPPLIVGVLAVLSYLNSLHGEFTFDDLGLIRDNPLITGSRAAILPLWTTVYNPGALYRPLTMSTYFLQARLGNGPLALHAVNVVLHAAVCVAAYALAMALLKSTLAATVGAAVFAVHPVHTEAVASIVGRAELLAGLFVVVSLLGFARAADDREAARWRWRALSLAALFCGLLAKESAFTGIALCVVVQEWIRPETSFSELVRAVVPYALVGVGYLLLRLIVVGSLTLPVKPELIDNPLAHVPFLPRVETALVVLSQYLALLAFPLRLSADYSFNEIPVVSSARDPRFVAAAGLFALLTLLLVVNGRRSRSLVLAAAFSACALALTANLLFPIGTIKAERLLYLPSLGWCLALGWLALQACRFQRRQVVCAAVVLLVTAYAGRTWARNRDWHDNFALFAAAVRDAPDSSKAHFNLGNAYAERHDVDRAIAEFREALRLYPPDADAAFGVGRMYEEKGVETLAMDWYARATQLDPQNIKARLNLGLLRYRRGEIALADAELRAGVAGAPDDARLLLALSLVSLAEGREADARTYLARAEPLPNDDRLAKDLLAEVRRRLDTSDEQTATAELPSSLDTRAHP
jgi:Flp pilus assembly protein TadD